MKKSWPGFVLALPCFFLCCTSVLSAAEPYRDITVAADGSGDYRSISEALNQLPMYLSIRGAPELTTATGKKLRFEEGRGRDTLRFRSERPLENTDFRLPLQLSAGVLLGTQAAIADRIMPERFQLSSKF